MKPLRSSELNVVRGVLHGALLVAGLLVAGLVVAGLLGCESSKVAEPPPGRAPEASGARSDASSAAQRQAAPRPGAEQPASPLTWTDPSGWAKETKPRPMRVATYRVGAPEAGAELAVFHFGPGDGGGVEPNVQRWIGQFSGMDAGQVVRGERRASSGLVVHVVEVPRGTYASGMPGAPATPKEDFALLGAIVESPAGAYFFKLTGPAAVLRGERERFFELLDSVRPAS